jgi:hypothetical protein
MIIGTRLEYCLSDILLNEVNIDDVYIIVADNQFDFKNLNSYSTWWDRQMDPMTQHLSRGKNSLHLFGYEECLIRVQQLVEEGKIAFRNDAIISKMLSDVIDSGEYEHWYQLTLREKDMEPAVKMAWDHYRMLAGLCK